MSRRRLSLVCQCGSPITCGQGDRHLSCSPVCPACWQPIASIHPTTGRVHTTCPGSAAAKKSKAES